MPRRRSRARPAGSRHRAVPHTGPRASSRTGRIAGAQKGAAVLILDKQMRCLAISRGDNRKDWNLPGGYTEPGESPEQTAVRELYEETGIMVTLSNLEHVYTHGTANVFIAKDYFRWPDHLQSEPFEGHVAWKPVSTLCSPSSTFHQHAQRLFAQLGLR